MTATLYKTDGTTEKITPQNGTDFQLEELQGFVHGHIEIVPLGQSSKIIIVNEEGKLDGLDYNADATSEWEKAYGHTDVIVGDAVICDSEMVK